MKRLVYIACMLLLVTLAAGCLRRRARPPKSAPAKASSLGQDNWTITCGDAEACLKAAASKCPVGFELRYADKQAGPTFVTSSSSAALFSLTKDVHFGFQRQSAFVFPTSKTTMLVKCRAAPGAPGAAPPVSALGFAFGVSAADFRAACLDDGHAFLDEGSCRGPLLAPDTPSVVGPKYCDGNLCRVLALAASDDADHVQLFLTVFHLLEDSYGLPQDRKMEVPRECRYTLNDCIATGSARLFAKWRWRDGHQIILATIKPSKSQPVTLGLQYDWPGKIAL